jgi:hypothetical protein
MDAGGISVARAIPMDAALVRDVLIRLRRDTAGSVARWTLGGRGIAELDVDFFPILTAADAASPAWSTTARLWDTDGVALVHVVIELRAAAVDGCELTLRPAARLAPWWSVRLPALLDLAHVTLDELYEELLWHATRDGVATERFL